MSSEKTTLGNGETITNTTRLKVKKLDTPYINFESNEISEGDELWTFVIDEEDRLIHIKNEDKDYTIVSPKNRISRAIVEGHLVKKE